ncbi:MAG: hypothetical protein JWR05_3539 [Mucilaginibacter sp.]|nr:hypothetical protein [Mucilaginibacter sp.]
MSLKTFLEKILPFLFDALQRAWDQLSTVQQSAITNSGLIGQLLKNNLTILGTDLVTLIVSKTGLTEQEVTDALLALAKTFGLTTDSLNDAVSFLQGKLSSASSNEEWNGLLQIMLNAGGTFLSGGTLNWVSIAMGIGEWAYTNIIKPKLAGA